MTNFQILISLYFLKITIIIFRNELNALVVSTPRAMHMSAVRATQTSTLDVSTDVKYSQIVKQINIRHVASFFKVILVGREEATGREVESWLKR